jgi:hypothetical protein
LPSLRRTTTETKPDGTYASLTHTHTHTQVSKVGVFSCGPKPLTKSVTEACEKVNKRRKLPFFLHQYENFS